MCVTGDHSTPMRKVDHSYEAVPFSVTLMSNVYGENEGKEKSQLVDAVKSYEETGMSKGSLGRFAGAGMLKFLLDFRDLVDGLE